MFNEFLSLLQEFPQYKEQIHALKMSAAHFARLFDEYEALCKQAHHIEQEIDKLSNSLVETLNKQRLAMKDELFSMIEKAVA